MAPTPEGLHGQRDASTRVEAMEPVSERDRDDKMMIDGWGLHPQVGGQSQGFLICSEGKLKSLWKFDVHLKMYYLFIIN